ncbi:MAG TPA: ribosome small subunit-dependent GTPase A [Blastocatellia bacterium]|nr:ribosome small subunit-dependent GTPase A [Blastocatellia bacterium]
MHDLKTLGWDSFFEKEFEPFKNEGYHVGRVALEHKGGYRLYTENGEMPAEITGRVRFEATGRADFPAVGDWVVISVQTAEEKALIHAILPRKSKFSRKIAGSVTDEQLVATNIDTVFLIQSLDKNYNLRRLERYLVLALESGADPVIILSKSDLCETVEERRGEVEAIAPGVPVHALSPKLGQGLEQLNPYLGAGRTIAFLGMSGVGKSTLINRLVGRDVQKVAEVRAHDDRGKHTTRHRELVILPSGGLLVDTPGMRELQLWDVGEGLSDSFTDVERLAAECRFSNCTHRQEPDCAVREAIENGSLDPKRLENYLKMGKELEYLESRQDTKTQLKRKERDRKIMKEYNKIKRHKRR